MTGAGVREMLDDILSQVYVQKIRPQFTGQTIESTDVTNTMPGTTNPALDRPSFPLNVKS